MRASQGYSLIEFMVALVVAVLLGIVMTILLTNTTHQASTLKESADISNESRTIMFLMTRDIANAGYMLSCVGQGCAGVLIEPLPLAKKNVETGITCVFYWETATTPLCPAVEYSDLPNKKLTLNYAATTPKTPLTTPLTSTDIIQVIYSLDKSTHALRRKQVRAAGDNSAALPSYVDLATNVVDMAFEFLPGGASPPKDISQLRSIKVALLTRSEQPDKKYTSPEKIKWLGGIYTVPTNESHYRFRVMQQDVFLLNPGIIDP